MTSRAGGGQTYIRSEGRMLIVVSLMVIALLLAFAFVYGVRCGVYARDSELYEMVLSQRAELGKALAGAPPDQAGQNWLPVAAAKRTGGIIIAGLLDRFGWPEAR